MSYFVVRNYWRGNGVQSVIIEVCNIYRHIWRNVYLSRWCLMLSWWSFTYSRFYMYIITYKSLYIIRTQIDIFIFISFHKSKIDVLTAITVWHPNSNNADLASGLIVQESTEVLYGILLHYFFLKWLCFLYKMNNKLLCYKFWKIWWSMYMPGLKLDLNRERRGGREGGRGWERNGFQIRVWSCCWNSQAASLQGFCVLTVQERSPWARYVA